MSSLLNRERLKRYLLARAQALRPALGMRHVSSAAVQSLKSRLRNLADTRRASSSGMQVADGKSKRIRFGPGLSFTHACRTACL